jgi:hypothetical protein
LATNEALVLDSLAINDGTVFTLEALDMTPPEELEEWLKGADSDGALLAREPKVSNRTITATIRVEPQSTMNLALAKIALIVDKLKECQRNDNGLALTWVPANSTLGTITFRCLSGQITGLPIDVQNGWFVNAPLLTLRLTCLPFAEGAEVTGTPVTSTLPLITVEVTSVPGDVEALGRLIVTDNATQSRRYVAWGLESRWYPTSSPPSLIVDSTGMVTTGFAGATATQSGAYSGATNNVIQATLRPQPQAVCGLGALTHVGAFRPQLRFYASATTMAVRLTYQALDGPFRSLAYQLPVAAGWNHVDLGGIDVPAAALGTQRWTGRIEAYSTSDFGGETIGVDAVWLMPSEQFARARGVYAYQAGTLVSYDQFLTTTAGAALNARVAPTGGTWATSGSATDFTFADAPGALETVTRATVSDASRRFAILGSALPAANEVSVDAYATALISQEVGVVARWVDASNYLSATWMDFVGDGTFRLGVTITGSLVAAQTVAVRPAINAWYTLRVIAFASGTAIGMMLDSAGGILASLRLSHASLVTGGTLDDGKPGFYDYNSVASAKTRYFDNFYVATPPAEPIACYSAQSIEFRSASTLREDSTGVYYGTPPEAVGSRFTVPPAGGPARKTRVAVIARRQDVVNVTDDDIADSTIVQVNFTPRYLVVPR